MKNSDMPTFDQLMEKFNFHNQNVQYHAHIANFISEQILAEYEQEARDSNYFTDEFFNQVVDEGDSSTEETTNNEHSEALELH